MNDIRQKEYYLNLVESNIPKNTKITSLIKGDMFFSQILYCSNIKKNFLNKLDQCMTTKYSTILSELKSSIKNGNKNFIKNDKYNNSYFWQISEDYIFNIQGWFTHLHEDGVAFEKSMFIIYSKWAIAKNTYTFNLDLFKEIISADTKNQELPDMLRIIHEQFFHPVFIKIPEALQKEFNLQEYKSNKLRPVGFFVDSFQGIGKSEKDLAFSLMFEKTKIDKNNPNFGVFSITILNNDNIKNDLELYGKDYTAIFKKMLLLTLYIFSVNNDVENKGSKGENRIKNHQIQSFDFPVNPKNHLIESNKKTSNISKNITKGSNKKPHIRKPHFSLYWKNDPENEGSKKSVIRWIPTLFINMG